MTITELAAKVINASPSNPVTVDLKDAKGNYTYTEGYDGYEYKPRRVAKLLQAFGFKAKALITDPLVREFTKAERAEILRNVDRHQAEHLAYTATRPDLYNPDGSPREDV